VPIEDSKPSEKNTNLQRMLATYFQSVYKDLLLREKEEGLEQLTYYNF